MDIAEAVGKTAVELSAAIDADALLVITETGLSYDMIEKYKPNIPVIAATPREETLEQLTKKAMISMLDIDFLDVEKIGTSDKFAIKLMTRELSRATYVEDAMIMAMNKGILKEDDTVVVVSSTLTTEADSIFVYKIKKDRMDFTLHNFIKEVHIKEEVFESVLNLALDIGREGREGRLIGTAFLLGDSKKVLKKSKQLIMNPFEGHLIGERMIINPEINETIKDLSQLDGVFVVTGEGVVEAAGRYLTVDATKVEIPRGLGTRHAAVAAMTKETDSIGITVSKSGGIVRIFKDGKVVMTIEPQRKIALRTESIK